MTPVCLILLAALGQIASEPSTQPASSTQPSPLPLPAPVSTLDVLTGFVDHVARSKTFPADAAGFIRDQFIARKGGDTLAPLLDESLALLFPDFKAALDAQAAGQKDAGRRFAALTKHADPYVAVNAAFFAAQSLITDENHRDAAVLLADTFTRHAPMTRYTTHADHLLFLLGLTQAHMLQYDAARVSLLNFLAHYPDAPERYRASATQMLTELDRRQPGRLGDVYDLMSYAHRELALGRTDEDVSDKQSEAVKLLSRLVKEAEEDEKKGGGGGKGGKGGKGKSGKRVPRNGRPSGPRDRSETDPGGDAEKDLHRARTAQPGESWGNMPPKEREQILQALQKQFPSQYRDLVEQYYRQISKDAPRP